MHDADDLPPAQAAAPLPVLIREASADDAAAIEVLTMVAFMRAEHSHHDEHQVIAALHNAAALALSLVADHDGYVVGHLAVSPVALSDGSSGWFALGPLAVGPGHQRQGWARAWCARPWRACASVARPAAWSMASPASSAVSDSPSSRAWACRMCRHRRCRRWRSATGWCHWPM